MGVFWDEALPRLKELVAEGHSASVMARTLQAEFRTPVTRNMVLGAMFRRGIPNVGAAKARDLRQFNGAKAKAKAERPARLALPAPSRRPPELGPAPAQPFVDLTDDLPPTAASLFELGAHCCRWPIGDGYCGRESAGFRDSFCEGHKRMGTRPSKRPFEPDKLADRTHRAESRGPVYRVW